MSYSILIASVVAVWALLSMIGSDLVERQAVVDASAAAEAKRLAAVAKSTADADLQPTAH